MWVAKFRFWVIRFSGLRGISKSAQANFKGGFSKTRVRFRVRASERIVQLKK